jgi:hypothetical protein
MHEARRHTFEALRVLLKLMRTAESGVGWMVLVAD